MSTITLFSTILITLALVFYSLGVWAEKAVKYLKKWHVLSFWTGFAFDVSGTYAMSLISSKPFNLLDFHTLTGQFALWLMLAHAIWATITIKKGGENSRKNFHRYSLIVWLIWLIPYLGGMIMGMMG